MNKKNILFLAIILIVIAGLGIFFYLQNQKTNIFQIQQNINPEEQKSQPQHAVHQTINSEKDFLAMMIYHHQEAVRAAKGVLERGGSVEEVRKIAENIVSTQEKEIEQMKKWYQEWFNEDLPPESIYIPMMRPLENLSGKELDKQFLEDMIFHHQGAISMAQQVKNLTTRQELLKLADEIINVQSEEIRKMEELLKIFYR
jgi:uncharacterized protein (DUF305 family)